VPDSPDPLRWKAFARDDLRAAEVSWPAIQVFLLDWRADSRPSALRNR
jgi:hypothetical protein